MNKRTSGWIEEEKTLTFAHVTFLFGNHSRKKCASKFLHARLFLICYAYSFNSIVPHRNTTQQLVVSLHYNKCHYLYLLVCLFVCLLLTWVARQAGSQPASNHFYKPGLAKIYRTVLCVCCILVSPVSLHSSVRRPRNWLRPGVYVPCVKQVAWHLLRACCTTVSTYTVGLLESQWIVHINPGTDFPVCFAQQSIALHANSTFMQCLQAGYFFREKGKEILHGMYEYS